jgi:hypothetical protein
VTDRHDERADDAEGRELDAAHDDRVDAAYDAELEAEHDDQADAGYDAELEAEHDAEHEARHDAELDAELDRLDDGGGLVGGGSGPARSEALPFVLTTREHFASAGDVEITGDARVDAATARLEEVPDLPTADHVAVYEDVHRRLQDALADADVR